MAISISTDDVSPAFLPTDTYFGYQWHLRNTGQFGGTPGIDINVLSVWDEYKGAGIKVAVIDDGFDLTHPDLAANFNTVLDYDYRRNDATPMYETGDAHGTATSGMIGANDNGIGMVGVAPDVKLVGLRVSFDDDQTPAMFSNAMLAARNFDVVNNSWGYTGKFADNFNDNWMYAMRDAIAIAAQLGRGGLGTSVVFSAGNSGASGDNVNYHNMQNSPYVISVAAIDDDGKIASFSTPGATVLVSAPGVAVYTTDNQGNNGYVSGDYVGVSGTSFSAPIVSGVIALMLDANENLGYRDVQEILAYSARKIDAGNASWSYNHAINWNGGGLHYSTSFGYGLVDAHAAVRLAETWAPGQGTYLTMDAATGSSSATATIPDGLSYAQTSIAIAQDLLIDRIEVTMDITHAATSQLTAMLISPTGTQSILINQPAGINTFPVFTFDSVAFWGESSLGNWTLRIYDALTGVMGQLNGWALKILGDTINVDDTYFITDEFSTAGSGPYNLSDLDGGNDTLNASALTTALVLDLHTRTGNALGRSITLHAASRIENVLGGDGSDVLYGSNFAETLHGNRGDDTLSARAGDDILYGDQGNDFLVGGLGNDTLYGGEGNDRLYGNEDNDVIYGGNGNDTVLGGAGMDVIYTDVGNDYVTGDAGNDVIHGGIGEDRLYGNADDDLIYGDDGYDTLYGGDGLDTIYGGTGNDTIYGEQGQDSVYGDAGNDNLSGGLGNDIVYGGIGDDRLNGNEDADTLYGEDGNDLIYGGDGMDAIYGAVGNDNLYGDAGNDTVFGGVGNDHLYGNGNDDLLYGDDGDDQILGGDDNDTIYGGMGNDYISGDAGNDTVYGGDGMDYIYGGDGDDILIGGPGPDRVYGGAGANIFVLDSKDNQIERIFDFQAGGAEGDRLDLSNLIEAATPVGTAIANFVKFTAANANDTYVKLNPDGMGNDFTAVAVISGASLTDTIQHYFDMGLLIVDKQTV